MAFIENHEVTIWENNVTGNETTMQMFDIMFGLLCFCFLLFFGKTRKTWCQGLKFVGIKNRDTKLNFYMTLQATVKILDLGWEMADPNRREAERGGGGSGFNRMVKISAERGSHCFCWSSPSFFLYFINLKNC